MNSLSRTGIRRTGPRLRSFARHLNACGERALLEFLTDLANGRPFDETVEDFGRLDPKILAELTARMADASRLQ